MATTVRRSTRTLPAAPLGPENPLPALLPRNEAHVLDGAERAALPPEMARQVGYAPLRSVLPTRVLDGYGRQRTPTALETIVLENARLRATVHPGLGGRLASLFHKPTGRELLYANPVFQPADFALNGAWFSGGVEWNIGATGHTTLSCAPLHAARVPAPGGDGAMVRLWEWERLRDTPFQVDLWLPEDSDFLYVGARIRNPHHRTVPVYWWSNIAVPESPGTRVLAPAEESWYFAYERTLRRIPVPEWEGVDLTYPLGSRFPADYFHEVPAPARKWIAALDGTGQGLVQTSTDLLRGRKLFVWGAGPGGRRWQEWLTEPGHARVRGDPGGAGPHPAGTSAAGTGRRVRLAGGLRSARRRSGDGARRGLGGCPRAHRGAAGERTAARHGGGGIRGLATVRGHGPRGRTGRRLAGVGFGLGGAGGGAQRFHPPGYTVPAGDHGRAAAAVDRAAAHRHPARRPGTPSAGPHAGRAGVARTAGVRRRGSGLRRGGPRLATRGGLPPGRRTVARR